MTDVLDRLPPRLRPLWDETLKRERTGTLVISGVVSIAGTAFISYLIWYVLRRGSYDGSISFRTEEWIPLAIGLLVTLGAVAVFVSTLRSRVDVLRRPAEVVWIYKSKTGFRTRVMLGTSDGKIAGIAYMITKRPDFYSADENRFEEELFAALTRAFPEATAGFSPITQQAFFRDPKSLRRAGAAFAVLGQPS